MKKIIIFSNPYRDTDYDTAKKVKEILEARGYVVSYSPMSIDDVNHDMDVNFKRLEESIVGADLLVCLGGDGTLLHVSKAAAMNSVPILGINLGRMGFIADIEKDEIDLLRTFSEEDIFYDRRMMLDISVRRNGETIFSDIALNDAVISKGAVAKMIDLSVKSDRVEMYNFTGDGIICCTATGSTAYSLSAGGPITEPSADNIIITPICPHTMSIRPFVLLGERSIDISVGELYSNKTAYLSVDGGNALRLRTNDVLNVSKSSYMTIFARIKNISFFECIHKKLQ